MAERTAAALLALACLACGPLQAQGASSPAPAPVDLHMRLSELEVRSTPDGERITVRTDAGPVELDPQAFAAALRATQDAVEHSGLLYRVFNITRPWGLIWIGVGFLGQALFTLRMMLQWLASEKERRSVVPVAFWWGSLFGGILLLVYFAWRKDIVGIVGQSTGVFVYARNLVLIHRGTAPAAAGAAAAG